jgi:hypothetical protein
VALLLAKACSPSPADVTPSLLSDVGERLPAAAVVELLTWLSILQLMHRLGAFYAAV